MTVVQKPIPELKKCPSSFSSTAPISQRKAPTSCSEALSSSTKKASTTGARFNVVRKSQILGKKSVVQKMNDSSTQAMHSMLVSPMN